MVTFSGFGHASNEFASHSETLIRVLGLDTQDPHKTECLSHSKLNNG